MVEEVINIAKKTNAKTILDLCTGSGAIAVSLAKYLPNTEITAVDISQKALKVAKKNAISNEVENQITFISSDLFTNLPGYYNSVTEKINELPEDNILRSEKATEIINNIKNIDFTALFNMERIQQYIKSFISAMETILDAFIAVIVSVYILAQRNAIIRFLSKFTKAVTSKNAYEKIKKYFMKSNSVFFKFLTSQVLDAILVGVLVSVALSILQVKYAVLLGFMIGLFNLIPYFGAIVAVVIAILITVLTGGIGKALLMTVVVVILQQIDANIINPKIVGDSLEISQLLVIFAVTLGGAYFGVIGMFLAVPVATVIKLVIEDFIEEREKSKGI